MRGPAPHRGRFRCRTPAPAAAARTAGPGRSKRWVLPVVVVLLWLFVGGPLGSFAGRLAEVQKNDNASFLPKSTESTRVLNEFLTFTGQESLPTIVVFERAGGLTDADKQAIAGYDAERSRTSRTSTRPRSPHRRTPPTAPPRRSSCRWRPRTARRSRRPSPPSGTWSTARPTG